MSSLTVTTAAPGAEHAIDSRAGWRVVVGAGLVVACGVPTLFGSTIGLFMLPIQQETGWSRAEIAFAFTLMSILSPVFGPFFGWLADRVPLRGYMLLSIALQSANIAAFGLVGGNVWTYYALAIALMFTAGGASAMNMSKLVQSWFDAQLGRALGVLFTCIGLGAVVGPMLGQSLISGVGWRQAYFVLGALALLGAGLAGLTLVRVRRGPPAPPTVQVQDSQAPPPTSYRMLLKHPLWWRLALWNGFFAYGVTGLSFHFAALMQDRGSTPAQSAMALSLMAVGHIGGNIVGGWLLDRTPARTLAVATMLLPVLPVLLLIGSTATGLAMFAGLLFGLCGGADGILAHYLVRRFFGTEIYGRALGSQMIVSSIAAGLAPWLAALVHGRTGSYTWPLMIAVVAFICAGASALLFPPIRPAARPAPAAALA